MRQFFGRFTLLSLLSLTGLFAAPTCSNRDFNGVYGMLARGTVSIVPPPLTPLIGPVIRLSRVTADGKGKVSVESHASYNGYIVREPFSGTYSVSPNCTIAFKFGVPLPIVVGGAVLGLSDPFPFEFLGALGDSGADVAAGVTSVSFGPPGSVIRVRMRRQDNDYGRNDDRQLACSERDLNGGYQLEMYGDVINTTSYPWPPLPFPVFSFSRHGTLTFDGHGGFNGDTSADYGGQGIAREALAGTYSVDRFCNVTIRYSHGAAFTWLGVITDGGKGANLLVTSPAGAAIAGTLLKQ